MGNQEAEENKLGFILASANNFYQTFFSA